MEFYNPAISYEQDRVIDVLDERDLASVLAAYHHGSSGIEICNTGHGFHSNSNTAKIVLDISSMRGVQALEDDRIRVSAGARWSDVREHIPTGKRVVSGSFPGVGVCGYLSGSGVGPDVRLVGPSTRYVDSLEVIDRQGNLIPCSREENIDVFAEALVTKGRRFIISSATLNMIDDSLYSAVDLSLTEHELDDRGFSRFLRDWRAVSGSFTTVGSSVQMMFMNGTGALKLRAVAVKPEELQLHEFLAELGVNESPFDLWGSQLSTLHAEPEKSPGSFMDGFGILSTAPSQEIDVLVDELMSIGEQQKFFGMELRHLNLPETLLEDSLPSELWRDVEFIVQHGSLAAAPVDANSLAYEILGSSHRRELPNFSRDLESFGRMSELIQTLR